MRYVVRHTTQAIHNSRSPQERFSLFCCLSLHRTQLFLLLFIISWYVSTPAVCGEFSIRRFVCIFEFRHIVFFNKTKMKMATSLLVFVLALALGCNMAIADSESGEFNAKEFLLGCRISSFFSIRSVICGIFEIICISPRDLDRFKAIGNWSSTAVR